MLIKRSHDREGEGRAGLCGPRKGEAGQEGKKEVWAGLEGTGKSRRNWRAGSGVGVRGTGCWVWLEDVKADLCRVRGQNGGQY